MSYYPISNQKWLAAHPTYGRDWHRANPHGKNPLEKRCEACEKAYPVSKTRYTKSRFCSVSCAGTVRKGALAGNWRGGKTTEMERIKGSKQYKEWRLAVFQRDHFTCVLCGDKTGGNLNADHIKPQSAYPELRLELSNGRTLCEPCHKQTDTWGSKAKKYRILKRI